MPKTAKKVPVSIKLQIKNFTLCRKLLASKLIKTAKPEIFNALQKLAAGSKLSGKIVGLPRMSNCEKIDANPWKNEYPARIKSGVSNRRYSISSLLKRI